MSPARQPAVEAAGCLVWRARQGRLQVVLVHRPRYKDWSWPKGKLEPGEAVTSAATREVAEETGHDVVLGMPLPGLRYTLADGRRKRVHYWAAQVAGRPDGPALLARPPVPRASKDEIDDVRWVDVSLAERKLTRAADREPLAALTAAYAKDRLDTRALVVARHGKARSRAAWRNGEEDRPLTPVGRAQALALVPVLSAYGVTEVVTSRWARCLDTVAPYLGATQGEARESTCLTETEHASSPSQVAAEIEGLINGTADVVVCTHRPVLPTVLDVIATHGRRKVADQVPVEDPFLRPGEVLVAHTALTVRGPRVVAVERHLPPLG
ncbi:NUDIX domain-containing protein [Cellulomonas sp. P22]|uniref:NUDIX hydrolase n=1 Tax=Cellulomonas sp. P22 TaxID=3373189 RepID=UPI0037A38FB0